MGILKDYLENNAPIEEVDAVMEPVCLHYMNKSKGYNGQYMCPGIVKAYIPIVRHTHNHSLHAGEVTMTHRLQEELFSASAGGVCYN